MLLFHQTLQLYLIFDESITLSEQRGWHYEKELGIWAAKRDWDTEY